MDSIVAAKSAASKQKDMDDTYNTLALLGLIGGLIWGSRISTKFGTLSLYGFAGVGMGGTLAYGYLYMNGAYS